MERERHPRFDGYVCIVEGCARVEYKHRLCRAHWQEIPMAKRIEIAAASWRAAAEAAAAYDAEIARHVEHWKSGMLASQSRRG